MILFWAGAAGCLIYDCCLVFRRNYCGRCHRIAPVSYLSAKLFNIPCASNSRATALTRCMQVGLRPRLKGRPSFYDLIKQRIADQLSIVSPQLIGDGPEVAASHLDLSASPTLSKKLTLPPSLSPNVNRGPTNPRIPKSDRMVPVSLLSSSPYL